MAYQLTYSPDTVIRLADSATVPRGHRFWTDYEKWLKAGGVAEPAFRIDPSIDERAWRDAEIQSVKWLRERHRDEVDSGRDTTLTAKQSGELLDYVQALRDWPAAPDFPSADHRPTKPAWIALQVQ